jgi:hypothetical protein
VRLGQVSSTKGPSLPMFWIGMLVGGFLVHQFKGFFSET